MIIPPANVVMQVMRCAEDIKEVVVEEEGAGGSNK